jgi:hypothetical protein
VISASSDNNIFLHRLSNGGKIGQFNQDMKWDVHDMTNYTKRPNLVRDWLMNKLTVWKKFLDEKIKIARVNGTINDEFDLKTVDKETL